MKAEYTVSTFAEEIGVSWNSVYKAGKELFPDKQWGKNAVLNGSTESLLNHYTRSSKVKTARKAKRMLSKINESTTSESIEKRPLIQSEIKVIPAVGFNGKKGENQSVDSIPLFNESTVTKPVKLSLQFTTPIECSAIQASDLINVTMDSVKVVDPIPEEPKESFVEKVFKFDLGLAILGSPLIRFLFVSAMIGGQSYMFAHLEQKSLSGLDFTIPFWAALVTGVLFEASGFMIAMSTDSKKEWQGLPVRGIWLFIMIVFQFSTNFCLIEPWAVDGWHCAGRFILSIAIPLGLLAYSFLYFKD